jgi:hypothetical protein
MIRDMELRMRDRLQAVCALAGVALLLPLVCACSRTAPKIAFGFIEQVYYEREAKPEERFSFFIIPDDEDGIENLEELYLYHDKEQLRWLFKSDDWVSMVLDGKTWIGSRNLANTEDESLPRGQYRAVLVNKGGEKAERLLSFDAPAELRFPFPRLEISEGRYTVASAWPENRLVCYDNEGKYVTTVKLSGLSGSLADLGIPANARTAALWADDTLYFTSAFTDIAPLR